MQLHVVGWHWLGHSLLAGQESTCIDNGYVGIVQSHVVGWQWLGHSLLAGQESTTLTLPYATSTEATINSAENMKTNIACLLTSRRLSIGDICCVG